MTKLIKGVNDLATVNPELVKEWCMERNGNLTPDCFTSGSNKLVWWKCPECGFEYQASIHNRHNHHGCPACYGKYAINGINDLVTVRPDLLEEWDYEKNQQPPSSFTERSDKKVWWKCKFCGHNWQTQIKYRAKGIKCPQCQRMYQSSFPEASILFYVRKYFPDTISRYKPEWLNNGEIDIYIPSKSTGIEYDGVHWHKNHVDKDTIKGKTIIRHGISLIRVREYGLSSINDGSFQVITSKPDSQNLFLEVPIRQVLYSLLPHNTEITIDLRSDYSEILSSIKTARIEGSLAKKRPDLLEEWNIEKNGSANPESFPVVSGFKVWWKCSKCGNEFQMTIGNRNAGHGCPKCAMQKKPQTKTTKNMVVGENDLCSIHPELLIEWDYEKNDGDPQCYTVGSAKKVWWVCKDCGASWMTAIEVRCKGHGCPHCSKKRSNKIKIDNLCINGHSFADEHPELLNEWDYSRNEQRPTQITSGCRSKVWWICSECKHSWEASIGSRSRGSGCPVCSGHVVYAGHNDFASQHPDLLKEWDYTRNTDIRPDSITSKSGKMAWWICSKCGNSWQTRICHRSNGSGCPECAKYKKLKQFVGQKRVRDKAT